MVDEEGEDKYLGNNEDSWFTYHILPFQTFLLLGTINFLDVLVCDERYCHFLPETMYAVLYYSLAVLIQ